MTDKPWKGRGGVGGEEGSHDVRITGLINPDTQTQRRREKSAKTKYIQV
jgi:hypothetical protein